ncbi:hypothetical protein F383_34369 [Gossypium arboreum]|uniref:Uncharacterized protein n=1 Tax=Gossypium arboreum TaxID=29729 RepID=A0A0B0N7B0_GOSAR|nr:hypothetical protein F383_34369 [Gossypium arboreum]
MPVYSATGKTYRTST